MIKRKVYFNGSKRKVFFNQQKRIVYFDSIVVNSHGYLERFSNQTLSRYTHKAINNGITIRKKEGE